MTGTIAYREHDWSYRTKPCIDDSGNETAGDIHLEVQHPGNMRWEHADYLLADATEEEVEEAVKQFADRELD